MGADIHVRIAYRDISTEEWKELKFYHKEENDFKPIDFYPYRNYEIFDILSGKEDAYFPNTKIFSKDLPDSIRDEIDKSKSGIGYYGFYEVNFADLKLYAKNHPLTKDYDVEWEDDKPVYKDNPIIGFISRIESILDLYEPLYGYVASSIRIIYWFDC